MKRYDAIVIATGATQWRELAIPGREYEGIHQAMEYLPWGNKEALSELSGEPAISAKDKRVVILGGGDTGADCLGTAVRQGAATITQIEIMPRPSDERPSNQPWPTYPMVYRVSSAHEEAGERLYSIATQEFVMDGSGKLTGLKIIETEFRDGKFESREGTKRVIPADLVFLALGFTGPEQNKLVRDLELRLDPRGNISRDENYETSVPGVFVCGDAGRGQSLIVWAIAEGRSAASAVDHSLMGRTQLPAPITPDARPMTV